MPTIHVTDRDGSQSSFEARPGLTLMEALRGAGYDSIEAICGGNCSCATCHVLIDPDWADTLPPRANDEDDLVADTDAYDETRSRLSCQIAVTDALDGLRLTVAPED
ncbi:2Fe-2S ferredoxin [Rhodothalassium salexigens DSM 2132]|uniref:2Fe-2S ferredoxin n=1 Tax=Rhodothalassium salexigens DSM 2132 TaxID=1188247 RepID=A0A4R2PLQ1_RHOSA|nr:2Fe-2S iron-sulfur cluster-binding protein [Rhodothalassium salexigens]MBB4210945.1 2Fe-2S ferredoxin [Rhodothalassium salexigens DSM 2132]MBK1639805.1 ferredoxin [Rhodothalassium salexigens DSM 2132]TCP36397.1 2Fe-2S ferredoxin [Rhodothalassium salexigens DSM 2132]